MKKLEKLSNSKFENLKKDEVELKHLVSGARGPVGGEGTYDANGTKIDIEDYTDPVFNLNLIPPIFLCKSRGINKKKLCLNFFLY